MEIHYKNQLVGYLQPDEMDPPFGSGFFTFAETLDENAHAAKLYLVFTNKEFELGENSKAYKEFGDQLENEFASFYLGEDWLLVDQDIRTTIYQPMMSREGVFVWSFE